MTMIQSVKTVLLQADVQTVWETVTDVSGYTSWRSDVGSTEILEDSRFIERTKDGYATTFTVTRMEPPRLWEFDMDNTNMSGHWTGLFVQKDGGTELVLKEAVSVKHRIMRLFVKPYLKHQQSLFVADLQNALLRKEKNV